MYAHILNQHTNENDALNISIQNLINHEYYPPKKSLQLKKARPKTKSVTISALNGPKSKVRPLTVLLGD